jgi:hypothetical protein
MNLMADMPSRSWTSSDVMAALPPGQMASFAYAFLLIASYAWGKLRSG